MSHRNNPRTIVLSLAIGGILAILLVNPLMVLAANGQDPNRQIQSSNTNNDLNSWDRLSLYTSTVFSGSSDLKKAFTYQMNSVVNNCTTFPFPCAGTYWIQGIVGIDDGSLIGLGKGWYVHDAHIELFYGTAGASQSICKPAIPQYVNIDQTNYNVLEQLTTSISSGLMLHLSVSNQNTGYVFYSVSVSCQIPNGATSVSYFTQVEGVIAGCGPCGNHMSFSPLNSNIYFGYIDLVSNYNHVMSSAVLGTQTAEGSNLYQMPYAYYSTTYGNMYLYTVMSDENTKSST